MGGDEEAEWSDETAHKGLGLAIQVVHRHSHDPWPVPGRSAPVPRGDVSVGRPVVLEHRSLKQIWERVPPVIAEEPAYDPNRDRGDTAKQVASRRRRDPLAFLVGPVEVVYGSDPAKSTVVDLNRYIDREKKLVRSITGELVWDYGRGPSPLIPQAQGVTGLLKSFGPIRLRDVTIDRRTPTRRCSSSRLMKSLWRAPVRARPDRHTDRATGWTDHAVTFTIDGAARRLRPADRRHRKDALDHRGNEGQDRGCGTQSWPSATLLDINGNAKGRVPVRRVEGTIEVELPDGRDVRHPQRTGV